MRRRSLLRIRSVSYGGCWSRRLKRRPLLQTSSPLNHQLRTYIGIGTANGDTSGALARQPAPSNSSLGLKAPLKSRALIRTSAFDLEAHCGADNEAAQPR